MKHFQNEHDYFDQVESCFRSGDYNTALKCADEGIERFPFSASLHAARGEVYFEKQVTDGAIRDYEMAIQLGFVELPVLNNLGLCYAAKKDYQKAIDFFSEAIRLDESCINTYLARAKAYKGLAMYGLALKDEEEAAKLESANDKQIFRENQGIIKFCDQCEEGFAARFDTCPNCGGELETYTTDQNKSINTPKRSRIDWKVMIEDTKFFQEHGGEALKERVKSRLLRKQEMGLRDSTSKDLLKADSNVPSPIRTNKKNRSYLVLISFYTGSLCWTAAYSLSVYQSFEANGFWKSLVIAIPIVGQFLWAGVKFAQVGLLDPYFYLLFAGLVFITPSYFLDSQENRNDNYKTRFDTWTDEASKAAPGNGALTQEEIDFISRLARKNDPGSFQLLLKAISQRPPLEWE